MAHCETYNGLCTKRFVNELLRSSRSNPSPRSPEKSHADPITGAAPLRSHTSFTGAPAGDPGHICNKTKNKRQVASHGIGNETESSGTSRREELPEDTNSLQ
ncbi:Usherin [Clarias magur]|uniref:Usherin n=1 Tax=Clarias magur TaxID=1594786 RepID=A0A8J4ULR4_CLAMG|nr:Usherin [Clarias magur]